MVANSSHFCLYLCFYWFSQNFIRNTHSSSNFHIKGEKSFSSKNSVLLFSCCGNSENVEQKKFYEAIYIVKIRGIQVITRLLLSWRDIKLIAFKWKNIPIEIGLMNFKDGMKLILPILPTTGIGIKRRYAYTIPC